MNLNKLITLIVALFALWGNETYAQYESVLFDEEQLTFNQGEPLPADQYFIITGFVEPEVEMIRFRIEKPIANQTNDPMLYENFWKRSGNNQNPVFEIPVNYALKGSNRYDISFQYYSKIDSTNTADINEKVNKQVEEYIKSKLKLSNRKIKLSIPYKEFLLGLENIILNSTNDLHNKVDYNFAGFSSELKEKLKKIGKSKIKGETVKEEFAMVNELIFRDINEFVNSNLIKLDYEHKVKRYAVQKTRNILAINFGYGGTISEQFTRFQQSVNPFIGLSFPLSNKQYSNAFVRNSAISLGISLRNYEDKNGNEVTGPIIKRPIYFAIGYKLLRVVRLNAGIHFLSVVEDGVAAPIGDLQIIPFFGISAELDVWVGVSKRKKLRKR